MGLFAVQKTLKSLLQYHSSKASILWYSAYFIAQLSHPYVTIGKTIALTRQTFVGEHGLQKNPALPPVYITVLFCSTLTLGNSGGQGSLVCCGPWVGCG